MLEPLAGGTPFEFLLVGAIAASVSVTVAFLAFLRWMIRIYGKTIGRRGVQSAKIRRLACGVTSDYVDDLLGKPIMLSKSTMGSGGELEERLYFLPDAFVMTYCVQGDVQAFAITIHDSRFAPRISIPWGGSMDAGNVRLGRAHYREILDGDPGTAYCWAGNHHWGYHEIHYMGNPGFYQTYILASNRASQVGWGREKAMPIPDASEDDLIDPNNPPAGWEDFRSSTAPNTFCVVAAHRDWNEVMTSIGPMWHSVRVLPDWRPRQ